MVVLVTSALRFKAGLENSYDNVKVLGYFLLIQGVASMK